MNDILFGIIVVALALVAIVAITGITLYHLAKIKSTAKKKE